MNPLRFAASALLCTLTLVSQQAAAVEYVLPADDSRLIGENQEYVVPADNRPLEQIASILSDDGYLFLGAAETVLGITDAFKPMPGMRGLYIKNQSARQVLRPPLKVNAA